METLVIAEHIADMLITDYEVDAEELTPETTLEDLSLDSLALVELSLAMEKKLGVRVAEGVLMPGQTIDQAAEALYTLRAQA